MDQAITDYILDHYHSLYYPADKQFEAHKVYGAHEKNGVISVYIYSLYKQYNKGETTEQSGHSLPALVKLKHSGEDYSVIHYQEPEDGSFYLSSIKKMFPKRYVQKALNDTGNVQELHDEIEKQVKEWSEQN